MLKSTLIWVGILVLATAAWADDACKDCHVKTTPKIVLDWHASKHFSAEVGCADCHGDGHS